MALIESPGYKAVVDIDRHDIQNQEDGPDLIVRCPRRKSCFTPGRVTAVHEKLRCAEFGILRTREDQRRVSLDGP